MVEADVKKSFTLQGSGRKYGVHTASSPGEPPAVDTGVLRASIMSDVQVSGNEVIGKVGPDIEHIEAEAEAGTDVEYGLYLELGTVNMQPRPFLRPALRRNEKKIEKIFKEANK
jgi:HK97 gp10 family phage protein